MNKPTFKLMPLEDIIPNRNNVRGLEEYFPEGCAEGGTPEERAIALGRQAIADGLLSIPPLQLSKREGEGNVTIGGNRRYWAVKLASDADSSSSKDLKLPTLLYSGLTRQEEEDLEVAENSRFIKPGMWAQSVHVQRLQKRGDKGEAIGNKLNCTQGHVSILSILSAMPLWVTEAGLIGKLSCSTVLEIYSAQKGKKNQKIDGTVKILDDQRDKILAGGASKDCFGIISRIERIKTEIQMEAVKDEAVKAYGQAYLAVENEIKKLTAVDVESAKAEFAKLIVPSDETNAVYAGQSVIERYQNATKFLGNVLEQVKALKVAETGGQPLPQNADSSGIVNGTPPQPQPDSDAPHQGQGETEASRAEKTFAVKTTILLSKLIVLCDKALPDEKQGSQKILDTLKARIRQECNAFLAFHKLIS